MHVKGVLRRFAVRSGLVTGSYADLAPSWIPTTAEWVGVEQMANRNWRPDRLAYALPRQGPDERLKYLLYFLDVRGKRVLELGPRAGHHTFFLDKMGAREIVGVEGRPTNVEVCNETKERYGLPARFVCQDLERLASGEVQPDFEGGFELVFNLGLLYHLSDPYTLLAWSRAQAPELFLGTHYVERRALRHYRPPVWTDITYRGREAKAFSERGPEDERGGLSARSTWLYEDHLLDLLRETGYRRVDVLGKDVQAGHPHLTVLAS
jgi:hypothetical protein